MALSSTVSPPCVACICTVQHLLNLQVLIIVLRCTCRSQRGHLTPAGFLQLGQCVCCTGVAQVHLDFKKDVALCSTSSPCSITVALPATGYTSSKLTMCVLLRPKVSLVGGFVKKIRQVASCPQLLTTPWYQHTGAHPACCCCCATVCCGRSDQVAKVVKQRATVATTN
jgi:hypothetical protein